MIPRVLGIDTSASVVPVSKVGQATQVAQTQAKLLQQRDGFFSKHALGSQLMRFLGNIKSKPNMVMSFRYGKEKSLWNHVAPPSQRFVMLSVQEDPVTP